MKDFLAKLFAGEQAHLKVDMNMIGQSAAFYFVKKSAIKFKSIELAIKTQNGGRQNELHRKLDHFLIKMTHSRIFVYKETGQHFVMLDQKQTSLQF